MKRLVFTLTSLALVGVACGRVDPVEGDTGGGGSDDGIVTGSAGKTASGGKTTGSGGSSGKGMVVGSYAGVPGKVGPEIGGAPSGGAQELGSDAGVGAVDLNAGGAAPEGADACGLYCTAYTQVCPQAGFGDPDTCTQDCLASLELDTATCSAGKRTAYDCIGNALLEAPNDCGAALAIAKQRCGSASPKVAACNATCLPTSISGDGTGCQASAECNGLEVALECADVSGGSIPCTCSIGGKVAWDIATGFDYSKAGCIDEDLFRLCANELP